MEGRGVMITKVVDLGGGSSLSSDFFGGSMLVDGVSAGAKVLDSTENLIWQQLQSERKGMGKGAKRRRLNPISPPEEVDMKKVIPQELLSEFHDGLCHSESEREGFGLHSNGLFVDLTAGVLGKSAALIGSFVILPYTGQESAKLFPIEVSSFTEGPFRHGNGEWQGEGGGQIRCRDTLELEPMERCKKCSAAGLRIGHFTDPKFREALLQSLDLKIVAPALLDGDEGGMGLRGLRPAAVIADGVVPFLKEATAADADAVALTELEAEVGELCSRRGRGPRGSSEIALRDISVGPVLLGAQLHEALARESSGEVAEVPSHKEFSGPQNYNPVK
ncbi:hypothetical protein AK812_SmicGene32438 [Symbiodinium microadriaticum]|uniref:Uncharacterized protein n=1 Tax=Symbiodinium microadriaticum TaxID=2951 RepID=A0A1Q9CU63_SYMMI|nr:hypothetical protein AK812_SmicGene32438 [Symbiodinium microadriaticum]